jgi:hypothetical protein
MLYLLIDMHSNARGNARIAICFSLSISRCDNNRVREKLILLLTFVLIAAVFMKSGGTPSSPWDWPIFQHLRV